MNSEINLCDQKVHAIGEAHSIDFEISIFSVANDLCHLKIQYL